MKTFSRLLSSALLALAPAAAHAVPARLTHQGVLFDAEGAPVSGGLRFVFRLYDRAEGGVPLWVEVSEVPVEGGQYTATLGESAALPADLFAADDLYLEVEVDGDLLAGRLALTSVPFALRAGVADDVRGDIAPRSVVVAGRTVIDAQGRWTGDPGGLQGPVGPQGLVGPQGPRGEPGFSPSADALRDGLAADASFLDSLATLLSMAFADALRGETGPQGPAGLDGRNGRDGRDGTDAQLPTGAVVPFALAACPSGWSPADGVAGRPDLRGRLPLGVGPRPQGGNPIGLGEGGGSHRYRIGARSNEFNCCAGDQGMSGVVFEWVGENVPATAIPLGDGNQVQYSDPVDHLPPYRGLLYCVKD